MVADEVTVDTRRAGAAEAWRWTSDGKGAFTIAPLAIEDAPTRGARVVLHLNDASQRICRGRADRAHRARAFRRDRRADRHRRQARRRAAPHRRRRRDLGEVQIRRHARAIYRILPLACPANTTNPRSPCIGAPKGGTNIRCWPSFPVRVRSTCSIPRARAATSSTSGAC